MNELRDVLERAERAVASVPLPSDGFERLTRSRQRRHRHNRVLAGVVALLVAAGGTLGTLALLRGMNHVRADHVGGRSTPSPSLPASLVPTGLIAQRSIQGEPAQRLGPFWLGVTENNACLTVGPLTIGPSWTFQDDGHDCIPDLGADSIRVGQARGTVHRDGVIGPPTRFDAVYGLVKRAARRVDVAWAGGEVSSVTPVNGRFLFVWASNSWPVRVTAISATGMQLATADLTPP